MKNETAMKIIKQYKNRKYYNVNTSKYINLDEVLSLYRSYPNTVVIVSHDTNEDVTKSAIASAVYEKSKNCLLLADKIATMVKEGRL